jgi:hypothetical protein
MQFALTNLWMACKRLLLHVGECGVAHEKRLEFQALQVQSTLTKFAGFIVASSRATRGSESHGDCSGDSLWQCAGVSMVERFND